MIFNITGGGSLNKSVIIVTAPTGSVVTASKDGITKSASEKNGQWRFDGLDNGTWTIKAKKGVQSTQTTQAISRFDVYYLSLSYFGATIQITYPEGSAVTVTDNKTTLKAPNTSGKWDCLVPNAGTWTVSCTMGSRKAEKTVSISSNGQTQSVTLKYFAAYINATWPAGSTCKATNGSTTLNAPNTSGSYTFTVPNTGTWTVSCSGSGMSDSKSVSITSDGQSATVALSYRATPEFTYSGNYAVVKDDDSPISDFANYRGNWKIRFLTSGTLNVKSLHGFNGKIDVFGVGGGGSGAGSGNHAGAGGGGGGYTKTSKNVSLSVGSHSVTIGGSGGETNAFGTSAAGGKAGTGGDQWEARPGGPGGSGGGRSGRGNVSGRGEYGQSGGTNGGDGIGGAKGQGTTTREFGESSGKLYAGGGGGGGGCSTNTSGALGGSGGSGGGGKGGAEGAAGTSGVANTGGGGGGGGCGWKGGGAGGSGIVVIRNARG